jgi:hypothetical protein
VLSGGQSTIITRELQRISESVDKVLAGQEAAFLIQSRFEEKMDALLGVIKLTLIFTNRAKLK